MRKESKHVTILHYEVRHLLSAMLCFLVIFYLSDVALADLSNFSRGVQIAAKFKSKAEGRASILKRLHDQKEITNKEYNRAILLYDDARSEFDSWLSGLQTEMVATKEIQPPDDYKASLEDAARQAEIFTLHVEALLNKDDTRSGAVDILKIVETFIDAGVGIWKELRTGDQQKRATLIKMLESVKWKSFDEI